MKTKVLLPVLAMFFAIGMSFATATGASDPTTDYILENGSFMPIGTELNCGSGNKICRVRLDDGSVHDVYDAADQNTLKIGDGRTKSISW